jgi:hypothetical protein
MLASLKVPWDPVLGADPGQGHTGTGRTGAIGMSVLQTLLDHLNTKSLQQRDMSLSSLYGNVDSKVM